MAPAALIAALALASVYALGRRLRAGEVRHRRRWLSAASGASIAYVFVDLLPELSARQRVFIEAAGPNLLFAEQRIYVVALAAFVVFYGLDRWCSRPGRAGGRARCAGPMRSCTGSTRVALPCTAA